jgi:hypothetical protein
MKYVDEFRRRDLAQGLAVAIAAEAGPNEGQRGETQSGEEAA